MKKILAGLALVAVLWSCQSSNENLIEERIIDYSYQDSSLAVDRRVEILISQMTVDEKIGQMLQVARDYLLQEDDIARFYLGSILSGGGSAPQPNTVENWADMIDRYQNYALETPLQIPLLYGSDGVHGHNNVVGATIFPHNIGLGATRNLELVEAVAKATAVEMAATGVNWNFAPCVTVPQNPNWGRTYEGFSSDPTWSGAMGAAAIRGYQGMLTEDLARSETILATLKHFAGDGGTEGGIDRGDTLLSEEDFHRFHIAPYLPGLEAGAGSVMASFNSWNGIKCHENKELLTGILREELGFSGILVSDWAAHKELSGNLQEQIRKVINAGVDIIMIPDDYSGVTATMKTLYQKGLLTEERLDVSVRRILTIKFNMGLFENPFAHREFFEEVGSGEHRALARRAVAESMVLLKNEGILPLSETSESILLTGSKADDLGSQCGGWTISWQGAEGDITEGETLREAFSDSTDWIYEAHYSGDEYQKAIVVAGESPYAEMMGDRKVLQLSEEDLLLIESLHEAEIPTVVILISGRPLGLESFIEKVDAVVAAWLPGSEGAGVVDVITGRAAFVGTLPLPWSDGLAEGSSEGILFPLDYGLSY